MKQSWRKNEAILERKNEEVLEKNEAKFLALICQKNYLAFRNGRAYFGRRKMMQKCRFGTFLKSKTLNFAIFSKTRLSFSDKFAKLKSELPNLFGARSTG